MHRSVVMATIKFSVVSTLNIRKKERVIAGNLRFEIVCNSNFYTLSYA